MMTIGGPRYPAWVIGYSLDSVNAIATMQWGWQAAYDKPMGRHYWYDHEGREVRYAPRVDRLRGLPRGTKVYVSRAFDERNPIDERMHQVREARDYAKQNDFEVIDAYPVPPWLGDQSKTISTSSAVTEAASTPNNSSDNSHAADDRAALVPSTPADAGENSGDG